MAVISFSFSSILTHSNLLPPFWRGLLIETIKVVSFGQCFTSIVHIQTEGRLQAVPFWSVEMVRSQRSETGARRNKREEPFSRLSPGPPPLVCSSFFALGYFAQPLDYPERDCLQSKLKENTGK